MILFLCTDIFKSLNKNVFCKQTKIIFDYDVINTIDKVLLVNEEGVFYD